MSGPLSDKEVEALRQTLATLDANEDAIGAVDITVNVRQKGATLFFKYENKVDAMGPSRTFAEIVNQAPGQLHTVIHRLLDLHEHYTGRVQS